jgi:hypothetical protein
MLLDIDLQPWAAEIEAGNNPFSNNARREEHRITGGAAATCKFKFKVGGKDRDGYYNSVHISLGRGDEGQFFNKEDLIEFARWLIDEGVRLDRCQRVGQKFREIGMLQPVRRVVVMDEEDREPRRPEDEF